MKTLVSLLFLSFALGRQSFGPELSSEYSKFNAPKVARRSFPVVLEDIVAKFVKATFKNSEYKISSTSASNKISHVYLQQLHQGVKVANAFANLNIDQFGNVKSFGSTFHSVEKPPVLVDQSYHIMQFVPDMKTPEISPLEALRNFQRFLKLESINDHMMTMEPLSNSITNNDKDNLEMKYIINNVEFTLPKKVPASLSWVQSADQKSIKLCWELELEMEDNWYHVQIDAKTGETLSLIDWVSDASYTIYPLGINDPNDGPQVKVKNPENKYASPNGWHTDKTTVGNNVWAHENIEGRSSWRDNHRPVGKMKKKGLDFSFPVDLKLEPESYVDAAVTNLFYWNNVIHDLFYVYGFDEKSGNFQDDNYGKGGHGNDAVIANAQDGSGYNNANFATPPDGQRPKMRMYVWNIATPMRDGDFESGIVIHEYAHGISTRLTGGPANSGCLGWGEAGGMGEGWGDFFGTIFRHTNLTRRGDVFSMGEWANGGKGIRKFRYAEDMGVNPSTYGYINKPGYWGVHAKGEVWAMILIDVYWEIVTKLGFDPNWYNINGNKNEDPEYLDLVTGKKVPIQTSSQAAKKRGGNTVMVQLVIDGMKLQPCYPSFVNARDAILEADEIGFDDLWRGFAKRGLGSGARSGGKESFEMPVKCVV